MTSTDWTKGETLYAADLDLAFGRCIDRAGDVMAGLLTLAQDPVGALDAVTLRYLQNYVQQPDAPHTGYTYGRQNGGWTAVLPLAGGTMLGAITTTTPVNPGDATNKQYVDALVASMSAYSGTWQVAANTPDIRGTAFTNGQNYLAITANPSTPETVPPGVVGIAGQTVHNGDRVIWSSSVNAWQIVSTSTLDLTTSDARYVNVTGDTMTGALILGGDPVANLQAATKQYVDNNSGAVTISDTAPASPRNGSLWWSSATGQLYVRYPDPNTTQWVIANNNGGGIGEAPSDGQLYGRNGAAQGWQPAATATSSAANVGRNVLHNSLFNIQQRGPITQTTTGYSTFDRWKLQIATDTTAGVGAYQMLDADRAQIGDESARIALHLPIAGVATAGAYTEILQPIENVTRLSGKTVTVSFWARYTVGTNLKVGVCFSQIMGTGGSPSANVSLTGVAIQLTGTWARYSATFTLPSLAGMTLGTNGDHSTFLELWFSSSSTFGSRNGNIGAQTGTIQLWGIQLEVVQPGQTQPTALEHPDPQQDLAKCQRFYSIVAGYVWGGYTAAGNQTINAVTIPVQMRAAPTMQLFGQSYTNASALAATGATPTVCQFTLNVAATGIYLAISNVAFSADL